MTAGDWLDEFIPQPAKRAATVLDATNILPGPTIAARRSMHAKPAPAASRGRAALGAVVVAALAGFVMGRMLHG